VESGTRWRRSASKRPRRRGEERGARMSAVEMVGGVVPFYRVREAIGQGGWPAVVGIQYRPFRRVKGGGELMGQCRLDGGNDEGGAPVCFGYSRVEESGRWRRTTWRRRPGATAARARPRKKKARVGTWAGVGISIENRDGLPWPLG
jgi:hypothetical protein